MSKIKIFIIPGILLGLLLVIVLVPFSRLNDKVARADLIMKGEGKVLALKEYRQAEQEWPILKLNLDYQKKIWESKVVVDDYKKTHPAVIIFLKDGVTEEQIQVSLSELNKLTGVVTTKYISREEALKIYRERNKQDLRILDYVTANILPMSIEVYMNDWSRANDVDTTTRKNEFVEGVLNPSLDI